jgi:hypothetical protein
MPQWHTQLEYPPPLSDIGFSTTLPDLQRQPCRTLLGLDELFQLLVATKTHFFNALRRAP